MESEQSRKQSLSKAETIEQLRTTINQLEGIIEELDTITVEQLPESPSLETLVKTTEKLEGTISKAKQTPPPPTETPVTEAATVTDTPEEPESGITEEKQTPPPATETPVTEKATITDTPEEKLQETPSEETQPPQAQTPETTAETPQEKPETSEVTPTAETPEPPKSQKKKWLIVGIVVVIAIALIPIGLQFLPTKSLEIAEVTPTEIISEQPIVSEELESAPELDLETSKETVEPEELEVTETPIPEISELPESVTTETTPEISELPESVITETTPETRELPEAVTTETTPEISELPEAVTTETTPETEAVITEIIPEAETELVTPEVKPQKKPKIKFTPEQNFIAAIEKRVENLTTSYESDLVTTIEADLNSNKLLITVDDQWYELNSDRQDKVSNEILKRSRQLEFKKLIIQDSEGKLLARSPVVGDNMVILQRTHES